MKNVDWHLRFFLTSHCNFACKYCNPNRLRANRIEMSTDEIVNILKAAYGAGVSSIHWTGGEPTIKMDFMRIIKIAKEIGFEEQILTTNGWNFCKIIDVAIANGLSRVNISLDTLSEDKYKELTGGMNYFFDVQNAIVAASKKFNSVVKINVVAIQENIKELPDFINFIEELKAENVVLKLVCIYPSNPAQLSQGGIDWFKKNILPSHQIVEQLKTIDNIELVKDIIGDNPNCFYYRLINKNVVVGIVALTSLAYRCGKERCRKIRVTPFGEIASCIQDKLIDIKNLSTYEQCSIFKEIINKRETEPEEVTGNRIHFRPQLGEARFGKVSEPVELKQFDVSKNMPEVFV